MFYYDIYIISLNGIERAKAISVTDRVLKEQGGVIDEECLIMLAETETEDPAPQIITDPDDALRELELWSIWEH